MPDSTETLPKFTGTSVIIGGHGSSLAQARPAQEAAVLIQVLFYAALGMAWIVPVMPLVRWTEKPDPRP